MARRREGEELRDQIVDAAARCLAASGAEGVTARELIAAAGVSTGTLYHYFPTLDLVLLAAAERAAGRQLAEFGDVEIEGIGSVLERLFAADRRDTVLPWLRQRAIGSASLRDALRTYDERVAATYVAGVSAVAGPMPADVDVEAVVEVVRALAEGFQLRLSSGTLTVSPERFAQTVIDLVSAAWLDRAGRGL